MWQKEKITYVFFGGAELDAEADVCPKCGCPVEDVKESEAAPQQVEVTGVKIEKKSKKIIAIAAGGLILPKYWKAWHVKEFEYRFQTPSL